MCGITVSKSKRYQIWTAFFMQVKLTLTIYNSMKYYINVEVLDTLLGILDIFLAMTVAKELY